MKGRSTGANNYSDADFTLLLDIVEELLPVAGKGWGLVGEVFNERAETQGLPLRSAKVLEAKFKSVSVFLSILFLFVLSGIFSGCAHQNQLATLNVHGILTVHMQLSMSFKGRLALVSWMILKRVMILEMMLLSCLIRTTKRTKFLQQLLPQ